jgi:potassium/hydrogen antiporter
MLGGSEGIGGIAFEDYRFASRIGTAALVLILFDGGMNTSIRAIREALGPATALATVGVVVTAGVIALAAKLFGVSWAQALLLGAIVSPTDAAAVFALLRGGGVRLKPKVGHLIEVESCVNDPMSVILTVGVIELAHTPHVHAWRLLLDVPVELAVGAGVGLMIGLLGRILLRRARLATVGLYPALTLALALLAYGCAALAHGSGFLAVYVAGVSIGSFATLPYRGGLTRVHDAFAWLSQIAMFLMLGLLVFPSHLPAVAGRATALGLVLAVVARPLAVVACLAPFRFAAKEMGYVALVGLRGAVPIILATMPVLADVSEARQVFDVVFFIVVVNSIIPGALIRPFTRWLDVSAPGRPAPQAVLEINAPRHLNGEIASYFVEPALVVCGARLSDIELPSEAAVMMIVRGQGLVAARGRSVLEAGDHVYVFFQPADRAAIELLFGQPSEGG